ncbi:hypothetical protein [Corallincola spongiicola]|uniref:Uncharacterized protein n=1 Tax=Corallincola spongiicola TaxID=2520508 RepID=A0ABY1WS62_9GAMM|nr:hypothetical protein [Corallincola spongiicola]TAA47587.1 hypothetical protein EXY25_10260 [Corallincola spongiicola]
MAVAHHGILDELVKSHLVRWPTVSSTGQSGADLDLVAKKSDQTPRKKTGSSLSAGAAAGLITAALAALIAELGS